MFSYLAFLFRTPVVIKNCNNILYVPDFQILQNLCIFQSVKNAAIALENVTTAKRHSILFKFEIEVVYMMKVVDNHCNNLRIS